MKKSMNFTVPPAAAFALYKLYKNGTLADIKNMIFEDKHLTDSLDIPESQNNMLGGAGHNGSIQIEQADTIHGQPAENISFDPNVYQFYDDTCAIQSQHLILQQFGIDVSQEELITIAKENGWYAEGYGTPMNMVGKLLDYYGINVNASVGNNIFNISNELAQGHQIIVGVDADELINPTKSFGHDFLFGESANHALLVVGIDASDPNDVQIIVTDPGTGNRQMAYSAEQFMDAWKDSDCFMVSTDAVPMANPIYPYAPIDNFAGIPMDTLDRLSGMDINMDDELYTDFVEDFLENPLDIDHLICQYEGLFTPDFDEMDS